MVRERPLIYVESTKNIDARRPYEKQIPPVLRALLAERPGAVMLMEYVGLSRARRPHRDSAAPDHQRKRSGDLSRCADAPAAHAAIVLAFDGDEIDRAVKAHPDGLTALRRFTAQASPPATIYVSDSDFAQRLQQVSTTHCGR